MNPWAAMHRDEFRLVVTAEGVGHLPRPGLRPLPGEETHTRCGLTATTLDDDAATRRPCRRCADAAHLDDLRGRYASGKPGTVVDFAAARARLR